jgi:hypothetical protein
MALGRWPEQDTMEFGTTQESMGSHGKQEGGGGGHSTVKERVMLLVPGRD